MPQFHRALFALLFSHGENAVGQHVDVEGFRVVGLGHPLHGLLHPGDFRPVAQQRFPHLEGKLQNAVVFPTHKLPLFLKGFSAVGAKAPGIFCHS